MSTIQIKSKEAAAIITALSGGVVPRLGIHHIAVGRSLEIEAVLKSLHNVETGNNEVRFWIGEFGSGKTFILQLIEALAIRKNFVVSTIDLVPESRLYSNDGKAVAVYGKLINNILTQTSQNGNALPAILDQWIEKVMTKVVEEQQIDYDALREPVNQVLVRNEIINTTRGFTSVGGFEFGQAISKYYQGYVDDDTELQRAAIRWLKGEYTAKSDASRDLGMRDIINDQNYYDMLKNFSDLFVQLGYSGFVLNMDEAINLYKIPQKLVREKNYEKILSIYNDCLQGNAHNLFVNIGGTKKFLEDEQRGLFSYNALKTRLSGSKLETTQFRDLAQPVIYFAPLTQEEVFALLSKLKTIFEEHHQDKIQCSEQDITRFMQAYFNRPGAEEYLLPREVIKGFLQVLSLLRQHPEASIGALLDEQFGKDKPRQDAPASSIETY